MLTVRTLEREVLDPRRRESPMDWDKITLGIALVLAIWFLGGRLPSGIWILGDRTASADRERTRLLQETRSLEPREGEPGDRAK